MNFEPSAKVKELQKRLQQFMDEHIYPGESTYLEQTHSADTWRTPPIMEEWKANRAARRESARNSVFGVLSIDPNDQLALETPPDSSVVRTAAQVLSRMGLPGELVGVPYGSDASKLARHGVPSTSSPTHHRVSLGRTALEVWPRSVQPT